MELEKQTVNLELAKKMEKLGFKQESLWWWSHEPNGTYCIREGNLDLMFEPISAYTVAELGEILPTIIKLPHRSGNFDYEIRTIKQIGIVCPSIFSVYLYNIAGGCWHTEEDITEANCRAKMLIYLKEKGLL